MSTTTTYTLPPQSRTASSSQGSTLYLDPRTNTTRLKSALKRPQTTASSVPLTPFDTASTRLTGSSSSGFPGNGQTLGTPYPTAMETTPSSTSPSTNTVPRCTRPPTPRYSSAFPGAGNKLGGSSIQTHTDSPLTDGTEKDVEYWKRAYAQQRADLEKQQRDLERQQRENVRLKQLTEQMMDGTISASDWSRRPSTAGTPNQSAAQSTSSKPPSENATASEPKSVHVSNTTQTFADDDSDPPHKPCPRRARSEYISMNDPDRASRFRAGLTDYTAMDVLTRTEGCGVPLLRDGTLQEHFPMHYHYGNDRRHALRSGMSEQEGEIYDEEEATLQENRLLSLSQLHTAYPALSGADTREAVKSMDGVNFDAWSEAYSSVLKHGIRVIAADQDEMNSLEQLADKSREADDLRKLEFSYRDKIQGRRQQRLVEAMMKPLENVTTAEIGMTDSQFSEMPKGGMDYKGYKLWTTKTLQEDKSFRIFAGIPDVDHADMASFVKDDPLITVSYVNAFEEWLEGKNLLVLQNEQEKFDWVTRGDYDGSKKNKYRLEQSGNALRKVKPVGKRLKGKRYLKCWDASQAPASRLDTDPPLTTDGSEGRHTSTTSFR